MMPKIFLYVKM